MMRIFRKRKKFGNFHGPPADAEPLPDIVYQMGAEAAARYVAHSPLLQNRYAAIDPYEQEAVYDLPSVYSHGPVPIADENPIEEISELEIGREARASSPLNFITSGLGIGRSRSRARHSNDSPDHFIRSGSPHQFGHRSLGTPVKFHRRPHSRELLQPRAASPYHFEQQERVPSPLHFRQQERVPSPLHFRQQERVSSPYHFVQQERIPSPLHFAQQSRPGSPGVARRRQRAQLSQELQHIEKQQRRQQEMAMAYPMQFIPQYQQAQQPFYPLINSNANMQPWYSMQEQMYPFY